MLAESLGYAHRRDIKKKQRDVLRTVQVAMIEGGTLAMKSR